MLASIFSCSTSFLACAMLAVLLLAIGMLGGFFRHTLQFPKPEAHLKIWLHITHSRIPGRLWVRQKSSAKPLSPAKRTCFLLLLLISPWFIPSSFSPAASLISQRQDKRYLKVFKVLLVLLSLMITAGPGWFAGRHILLGGGSRALLPKVDVFLLPSPAEAAVSPTGP